MIWSLAFKDRHTRKMAAFAPFVETVTSTKAPWQLSREDHERKTDQA